LKDWRLFRERSGALPAKGKSLRIVKTALRTPPAKRASTLPAKTSCLLDSQSHSVGSAWVECPQIVSADLDGLTCKTHLVVEDEASQLSG
jgi:hypothetical protein